jgi:hypothetical protein
MSRSETAEAERTSETSIEISRLVDEIHALRQAVDDLREELVWELRQLRAANQEAKPPFRLTSMPLDPTAADFAQRVNAVDASVFAAPDALAELMHRLTAEPPTAQLAAEDWIEDQEFTPGDVVEIEAAMRDWFAEYLVVVKREAEWFLADDGEGWLYLLWSRDNNCYLRLLTEGEQREVAQLSGIECVIEDNADEVPPLPAAGGETSVINRGSPAENQRSLF